MDAQTRQDLLTALGREAFAHARYTLMSAEARKEGDEELASLLQGIAQVELHEHFARLAELEGLVGADADNLADVIGTKNKEVEEIYRDFAEQARTAGEIEAALLFEAIRADEIEHLRALEGALERLEVPA